MDDAVRTALVQLCTEHGTGMLADPVKLEAFLRDTCPGKKAEIHCLVTAVREGAVADLRGRDLPPVAAATLLAARLREDLSMQEEAADWTAQSLAAALATEPPPVLEAAGAEPAPEVANGPGVDADALSGKSASASAEAEEPAAPRAEEPEGPPHGEPAPVAEAGAPEDAGSLDGDLRPEEYVAAPPAAPEPEPVHTTAVQQTHATATRPVAKRSRRGLWIGVGVAAAVLIAVVVGVVVTSNGAPSVASQPPATPTPTPLAVAETPTPVATTNGQPQTVRIFPGGPTSLGEAWRDVAQRGKIILASGTYRVNSVLAVSSVTLVGQGARRTRVVFSPSTGMDVVAGRVTVRGIAFSIAGKPRKSSVDVVRVSGSSRAEFSHCRFNGGNSGLGASNRSRVMLRNCIAGSSYYSGIWAADRAHLTLLDTSSSGSLHANGLYAYDSARVTVNGGTFSNNQQWGMIFRDRALASVRGCLVLNNSRKYVSESRAYGGASIWDHARVDCLDSLFRSARGFAIVFDDSSKGTVAGNQCSGAPWGIQVQGNAEVKILGGNTNVQ